MNRSRQNKTISRTARLGNPPCGINLLVKQLRQPVPSSRPLLTPCHQQASQRTQQPRCDSRYHRKKKKKSLSQAHRAIQRTKTMERKDARARKFKLRDFSLPYPNEQIPEKASGPVPTICTSKHRPFAHLHLMVPEKNAPANKGAAWRLARKKSKLPPPPPKFNRCTTPLTCTQLTHYHTMIETIELCDSESKITSFGRVDCAARDSKSLCMDGVDFSASASMYAQPLPRKACATKPKKKKAAVSPTPSSAPTIKLELKHGSILVKAPDRKSVV